MVFRIRYRHRSDGREREAVIEANTPTEAMVKFHHAHPQIHSPASALDNITSVSSETDGEHGQW